MKQQLGNGAIPAPPEGFEIENPQTPKPPEGFQLVDDYERQQGVKVDPTRPVGGGIGQALVEGAKQTGRMYGSFIDAAQAELSPTEEGAKYNRAQIEADAQIAPQQTGDQFLFDEALQRRTDEYGEDGIWQVAKNVGGAIAEQPIGALHKTAEFLPGSAAVLGGAFAGRAAGRFAGAKVGAAIGTAIAPGAGTAVGGIIGGIAGYLLGTGGLESGAMAQEDARAGDLDTGRALRQGFTKGAVITGVDGATFFLNRLMMGAPGKAAAKASQEAIEGILSKAGVNAADDAAVLTAVRLDPGLREAVMEGGKAAYLNALPSKLRKAAIGTTALGLETTSEGVGEYLGSMAAGREASLTDAVLESVLSLPQSLAETGISAAMSAGQKPPSFDLAPKDPNAPWPGYEVGEVDAMPFPGTAGIEVGEMAPEDVTAAAAPPVPPAEPFPGAGGIQVDPLSVGEDVTMQSPSPIQQMADRLRERVANMRRGVAFEQAEREANARREAEIGAMGRDAIASREMPGLAQLAANARRKLPEVQARRAELERPPLAGIEVEEAFPAPQNPAMADALRRAGAVQDEEAAPQEIRPKSGQPYKTEASARNVLNIRKDIQGQGYEPVEVDGGWVLRKAVPGAVEQRPAGEPQQPVADQKPAQGERQDPYEQELGNALQAWSKNHDDAYKAMPGYAEQEAAFRKGFEDRAAGRGSDPGDLKYGARRDYELGFGMGKYGADFYDDWAASRPKKKTRKQEAAQPEGATGEAETRAKEMRDFDEFKSWARGRYGREEFQRKLSAGELNDIWNKIRGKAAPAEADWVMPEIADDGSADEYRKIAERRDRLRARRAEINKTDGVENGIFDSELNEIDIALTQADLDEINQTMADRGETKEGLNKRAELASRIEKLKARSAKNTPDPTGFTATHELPDGTRVRAVDDEPGVYVDVDGQEYEEPNATEIAQVVEAPAAEEGGVTKKVTPAEVTRLNRAGKQFDAYTAAKNAGHRVGFGPDPNTKDGMQLYTEVEDLDDLPLGIKAFVGRNKDGEWTVVDKETGATINHGVGGKQQAGKAAAIENARKRTFQQAQKKSKEDFEDFKRRMGLENLGQDELERRFVDRLGPKPEQAGLELRGKTGGDQVIPFPYASGLTRPGDLDAALKSSAGIGIDASELSTPMIDKVAQAVADGKSVFVDSGAFRAFKRSVKNGEDIAIDFDKVFARYMAISDAVKAKGGKPDLLMLVMPDVVGDQEATFQLLRKHFEQIAELDTRGHEVVIPLQAGEKSIAEFFGDVETELGHAGFVAGIPSNAKALSAQDFANFIRTAKPNRIHILGAVQSKAFESRMETIREVYEDDVPGVTADANLLRSKIQNFAGLPRSVRDKRIPEILDAAVPPEFKMKAADDTAPQIDKPWSLDKIKDSLKGGRKFGPLLVDIEMRGYQYSSGPYFAWISGAKGAPFVAGTQVAQHPEQSMDDFYFAVAVKVHDMWKELYDAQQQAGTQPDRRTGDFGKRWDAMDYGQRQAIAQRSNHGKMRQVVHRISGSKWEDLSPGEQKSMQKAASEQPDRRKDAERRKRVDQMSEAEMRRELLTDTLTGLGNRRAYQEDLAEQPDSIHGYMDVDALKWVNDNMGHESGDALLKAMGDALLQAVGETGAAAYHLSGDEFVVLAETPAQARQIAERAQEIGKSAEFEYTAPDGTKITKTGVEFSYGVGQDLKTADEALQRNKAEREAAGLRAPRGGVPSGVATTPAEGGQAEVQGAERVAQRLPEGFELVAPGQYPSWIPDGLRGKAGDQWEIIAPGGFTVAAGYSPDDVYAKYEKWDRDSGEGVALPAAAGTIFDHLDTLNTWRTGFDASLDADDALKAKAADPAVQAEDLAKEVKKALEGLIAKRHKDAKIIQGMDREAASTVSGYFMDHLENPRWVRYVTEQFINRHRQPENPKWNAQTVQTAVYREALADDRVLNAAANTPDNFRIEMTSVLAERIVAGMLDEARTGDKEAAKAYEQLLDGSRLREDLFDDAFFEAALKEAAKRKARADREDAKRKAFGQIQSAYDTALEFANPSADWNDEQTVAFKLGWDHAIDGKTASNLPTADVDAADVVMLRNGYERGLEWVQSEEGAALLSGKGAKVEGIGERLRRIRDIMNMRREAGNPGLMADEQIKAIIKETTRADVFEINPAGKTPGTVRLLEDLRNQMLTFKEVVGDQHGGRGGRGGRASYNSAIYHWIIRGFDIDVFENYNTDPESLQTATVAAGVEKRIQELSDLASDYVEKVGTVAKILNKAKTVEEASELINNDLMSIVPFEVDSRDAKHWKYLKHPTLSFYGAWLKDDHVRYITNKLVRRYRGDENQEAGANRNKALRRPRLDKIERKDLKDYRGGKDVTPEQIGKTFGFTTITIGDSVTSKQRQDHLNYTYDAFMDLADRLKIDPKNISFGGRMGFAIGALGSGRHSAHFNAAHPITNDQGETIGQMPVINVTNTRGDGAVAHEWGHALDYFLRQTHRGSVTAPKQAPYIEELVNFLRKKFPSKESVKKKADDFLYRGTFYEGMKRDGKVAMARHYLERSLRVYDTLIKHGYQSDSYAGPGASSYHHQANLLGKDYWGNDQEMFARAFEAFINDTLGGTDTYLVSDWVADGYVTKAKGYRGAPYPEGRERETFNAAFEKLVSDLSWENGLPSLAGKESPLKAAAAQSSQWTQEVLDELPENDQALARAQEEERARLERERESEREQQVRAELEQARAEAQKALEDSATGIAAELGNLSTEDLNELFDAAAAEVEEAQQETATDAPVAEQAQPEATDKAEGSKRLIAALVKRGFLSPMDWRQLFALADASYGGTQAQGVYNPKDAYDAVEVAINLWLLKNNLDLAPRKSAADAVRHLAAINRFDSNLPTQTKRTEEQDEFQQFSTPHGHAYVMAWAANLAANDVVLEPSAGTGNLATLAAMAGVEGLILNEFSERRAGLLADMELGPVYRENAEYLNSTLPADARPTVVIMNPPFSATAGRVKGKRDTMVGAGHIEQGLMRLVEGGRMVALVGEGMAADRPAFREWWKKIQAKYNVRANIGISGEAYRKFGTTFDNQILIIDKTGPTSNPDAILRGEVDRVEDLIGLLEGIRNDRVHPGKRFATESGGEATAAEGSEPRLSVPPATGAGSPGAPAADAYGDGRTGGGDRVPGGAAEQDAAGGRDAGTGGTGRPGRGAAGAGGSGRGRTGGRRAAGSGTGTPDADRGRGLGEIAKDAAKHGVKGVDEALTGLFELFGGKSLKSFPSGIDPDTYAKAKPHFERAFAEFKAAGQSVKEFFAFLIRNFGAGIKPYAVFFAQEKQAELSAADTPTTPRDQDARVETLEKAKSESATSELTDSVFETYSPAVTLPGAKPHPGVLAESSAMAAVQAPDVDYVPNLPKSLIEGGAISDAQIEQIIRAGAAHQQTLPNGTRRGYFIGDGTGVGKAREIVGIMFDNMRQGRKRHIWVTKNDKLLPQAIKDWTRVTGQDGNAVIMNLGSGNTKAGDKIKMQEGVLFVTYGTLIGGEKKKDGRSRLDQILEWAGEDFDGVIAFDEAHEMKSSVQIKTGRGKTTLSKIAAAGIQLQEKTRDSRVVYVSATGATEVFNLGYATRLGLWGEGTAFANAPDFVSKVDAGGVAAMELVAQNLKSMGLYGARSLSYDDVTYGQLKHELTQDQITDYNVITDAWQVILQNIDAALNITNADDTRARRNAIGQFWGANQRFFNQYLTSIQMPSVIKDVERQLEEGNAVVLQLVNTEEQQTDRAVAQQAAKGIDLEELDLTPRQMLMQYVENSFPTTQYEEYLDDEGKSQKRPAVDSKGNPIQNAEAVAMRDALLDKIALISFPEGALDQIINHFGTENVAEVTGRGRRFIRTSDGKLKEERRNKASIKADADAFMDDRKKILVFSYAGGTGQDYHADLDRKNQRKRIHYLVQPGWIADKAVQGFGRTHRSNQKQAPHYVLPSTNLKGHLRFMSSISRRLDQLGALTKGQRQTGSQGIFTAEHNLETPYSNEALYNYIRSLKADGEGEITLSTLEDGMGLSLRDKDGNITSSTIPSIKSFLNRLLALNFDTQNAVFDGFFQALQEVVDFHVEQGDFDAGIENITAQSVTIASEQSVYEDQKTGATTSYVALDLTDPTNPMSWPVLLDTLEQTKSLGDVFFARNTRSGRVYAFRKTVDRTDRKTGSVVQQYRRLYPGGWNTIDKYSVIQFEGRDGTRRFKPTWEPMTMQEAAAPWQKDFEETPKTKTRRAHMITGAILPIWDRFGSHQMKVKRVQTDDGRRLIGVELNSDMLESVLKNLGVSAAGQTFTTDEVLSAIRGGSTVRLANGWRLTSSRVADEQRIELLMTAADKARWMRILTEKGLFGERINYDMRLFVPMNRATEIVGNLTKDYPVIEVAGDKAAFSRAAAPDAPAALGFDLVQATANRIIAGGGLARGIRVNVVATEQDLPLEVLEQAEKEGALGEVVAVHIGRDIYIVADRHTSVAQVEESILHEGTHYGAKQLFGGEQHKSYQKLWFALGGVNGLRDLGAKLGFKMDPYIKTAGDMMQSGQMTVEQRAGYLVDEFLAMAQGQKAYESLPEKAVRAIREFWGALRAALRTYGFVELPTYTESDLAFLLRNINRAARGQPVSITGIRQAKFMRAMPQTATAPIDGGNTDIQFSRRLAENEAAIRAANKTTLKEKGGMLWDAMKDAFSGPLGNLPNVRDYLKRRYLTLGRIAEIDEAAKEIYDVFADAGDDIPAVYEYLTTREATDKAIKNRIVRDKAIETKARLEEIGQQLVDRGLLSAESFENNRGQYLPRIYLKHLLKDADIALIGTGKKPSDLGYLKARQDIPEEIRRLILGEITDPGYLASKGFGQQSRDIALLDWLGEISENRDWVWQQSLVEWAPAEHDTAKSDRLKAAIDALRADIRDIEREVQEDIYGNITREGRTRINKMNQLAEAKRTELAGLRAELRRIGTGPRKVTPFWLLAEAERLRAQAHYLDVADAPASRALADRMEAAARGAMDKIDLENVPEDFKQMPDSPRFGSLRGLIVRKEIYNDIVGTMRITTGDEAFVERILGHGGMVTKANQLWKWSKVAANPPAQVRNFVSNGILLHLSGVPFHKVPLRVIQAIKQIRARAQGKGKDEWKHYDVALRHGVTESTFAAQELLRMERDLLALEARNANKVSLASMKSLAGKVMDLTGDWYQFAEALFKTAKIIDAMEREGMHESDAAIEAQKWLFDYSLVGPNVQYLRNAPIGTPFITFQVKVLPRLLEVARTAPWRFLPYVALPYVMASVVAGMSDVDEDDVDALRKALPEWLEKRGNAYILPMKDDEGRWQAMDFGYFLPWSMWTALAANSAGGNVGGALLDTGLLGGPLPDLVAAIQTNRDPFTGRDIVNEADPPATQIMSIVTYLWAMAMPTWLTHYGSVGHLLRALEGDFDQQGLPRTSVGQAGLRLVGVNLYPIDPDVSRATNLRQMRFQISEINQRMRQKLRNPGLSPEERASIRDQYVELIKKRMEQMAKYAAESQVHPNLRRQ